MKECFFLKKKINQFLLTQWWLCNLQVNKLLYLHHTYIQINKKKTDTQFVSTQALHSKLIEIIWSETTICYDAQSHHFKIHIMHQMSMINLKQCRTINKSSMFKIHLKIGNSSDFRFRMDKKTRDETKRICYW